MARNVAIGIQSFEDIRKNDYFYIDKTSFIKEWWEAGDSVTLIARGIPKEHIRSYGFAFEGKKVLIG